MQLADRGLRISLLRVMNRSADDTAPMFAVGRQADMIRDLDIYRSAKLLIDQHEEDAPIFAAMRVDKLFAAGDLDGSRVWRRVLRAIEVLTEKRSEEPLH